jgi:hypothetical protein
MTRQDVGGMGKTVVIIVLFFASNLLSNFNGRRFAINGTFVTKMQLQQRNGNMSDNETNVRTDNVIARYTVTSLGNHTANTTGNVTNVMTTGLRDHGEDATPKAFVVIVSCIKSMKSWKSINGTSLHELFLPSVSRFLTDDERTELPRRGSSGL